MGRLQKSSSHTSDCGTLLLPLLGAASAAATALPVAAPSAAARHCRRLLPLPLRGVLLLPALRQVAAEA